MPAILSFTNLGTLADVQTLYACENHRSDHELHGNGHQLWFSNRKEANVGAAGLVNMPSGKSVLPTAVTRTPVGTKIEV